MLHHNYFVQLLKYRTPWASEAVEVKIYRFVNQSCRLIQCYNEYHSIDQLAITMPKLKKSYYHMLFLMSFLHYTAIYNTILLFPLLTQTSERTPRESTQMAQRSKCTRSLFYRDSVLVTAVPECYIRFSHIP